MKRSNVFIQSELSSCGACCIESVLSYYGGYVPHEIVMKDSNTTKSGTSAYNIIHALSKYGFNAYGIHTSLEEIKERDLPVIVHTNINGYNHFMVIYDIKKDCVIVMDPRVGKYKYSTMDFKHIFTGYAINTRPISKIVKYERISTLKKIFITELLKDKKILLVLFTLSLFYMVISITTNFYIKISTLINNKTLLTFIFILLILIKYAFNIIRSHIEINESMSFGKRINEMFMNHIFKLNIEYLSSKRVGEITKKISDMTYIKDWFLNLVLSSSLDIIILIFGFIIIFVINMRLTLMVIGSLCLYLIITYLSVNKIYDKEMETIYKYNAYNGDVTEYLEGIESIKNLQEENLFLGKINKSYYSYLDKFKSLYMFNVKIDKLKDSFLEIMFILTMMIGLIEIDRGIFNVYDLITFNSIYAAIISSYTNIVSLIPSFMHVKAEFMGVSEFLNLKPNNNEKNNNLKFNNLEIKNLSYSYNTLINNINDVNLKINKGDKILITGPSGSGKSTFVKCLCGYLRDYTGNILFNGITLKNLNDFITYVGQEERLFTGTIKENIMLSSNNIDLYDKSIRISLVGEILSKKFDIDNDILLEAGKNLSGGERARIILARGLCKNKQILIIDETLSSISEYDENRILSTLLSKENLTLLYITHRNKEKFFEKEISFRKDGSYEVRGMEIT